MARKQVGMIDGDLLARVDACALTLGQTRRVFTERALEAWLKDSEGDPAAVMERRILAARATSDHGDFMAPLDELDRRATVDERLVRKAANEAAARADAADADFADRVHGIGGHSARRHAATCKCGVCKPSKGTR